jgi:hypothetical protein
MEKVKYLGTSFDLVPGGFGVPDPDGRITIRHQLGGKTLEEIKAIAKGVTATDSIDLLDAEGKLIKSVEGYIYGGSIQQIDDYLVETRQPEPSQDPESSQEPVQAEEARADIAVVTFRLPDVREKLAEVKAIQDEILVAMLEGGV